MKTRRADITATGIRFDECADPEGALAECGLTPEDRADLAARRAGNAVYVTVTAFVEFVDDNGESQRWTGTTQPPQAIEIGQPATSQLLAMAENLDVLDGDLGIGGYAFSRNGFAAAPRRLEMADELSAKFDAELRPHATIAAWVTNLR